MWRAGSYLRHGEGMCPASEEFGRQGIWGERIGNRCANGNRRFSTVCLCRLQVASAELQKLSAVERQKNGTLLSLYLGISGGERIPDFKRLPVVGKLTPAVVAGGQGVVSGMGPDGYLRPGGKIKLFNGY